MNPDDEVAKLDPARRAAVARTWSSRALAERESRARFARLAVELEAVGARDVVVNMARRAAEDERRHATICAEVTARYSGVVPDIVPPAAIVGPANLGLRDRVLWEVVAFSCIAETINACLLTVTRQHARVPAMRRAVRQVLGDEIDHSRLGWAHLASERADGRGEFLADALPRMLLASVDHELLSRTDAELDPELLELLAHGNLPNSMLREIFEAAVRDVILPGMGSLGIDIEPARAWMRGAVRGG